jgi:hypothetical protein
MTRPRGARPSPRHKLASAAPHRIVGATPPSFFNVPAALSMFLNDREGDCVSAEEFFAKAATTSPESLATDSEVAAFVDKYNLANGAELTQVMDLVIQHGLSIGGEVYTDGRYASVDWTNDNVLRNAISQGPVKIGVAAAQLESAVGAANGWFLVNARTDQNIDHCVSLCGYGTLAECAKALGVAPPSGADPSGPAYLLFTWSTVGVIDRQSLIAICAEAWLRNPTTVVISPPAPTPPVPPVPTPTPTPTPKPVPPVPSGPTLAHAEAAVLAGLQDAENLLPPAYRGIGAAVLSMGYLHARARLEALWR